MLTAISMSAIATNGVVPAGGFLYHAYVDLDLNYDDGDMKVLFRTFVQFLRVIFHDISCAGSRVRRSSRHSVLYRDHLRWCHVHHRGCRDLFGLSQLKFRYSSFLNRGFGSS